MTRGLKLGAALAALMITAGCGLIGGDDKEVAAPPVTETTAVSDEPEFEPVTESPTPEPTTEKPAPKPSRTTKEPKSVEPTQPAFWSELPACAHYDKTKPVAKKTVKKALKAASARVYWRTEAPTLKLNYPLVKAIAWQESGWQTNIHNCDGGAGVMQLMPDTVDFVNNRFGLDYDASDYKQNAFAGANYIAWFTRWAGQNYFGENYNLNTSKCKSHTSWCLLNVVISGYNAGQGGIEAAAASKTLPNPQYVAAVRSLMSRCECDQF
ncbi:transglycosylase SLT domain-containing protein [Actinoplanes sp. LDG1-06]|uniref:Transglycosylase SLT domain-containing protein n=1 Tax=Paractinoplanes ovalisporus TaxID=2810368 RepID=A0ABS2A689_9ACTN|nr:lytic transglycosylase domain-containing protein [Actinoplanes ovalisporus]MBM2615358.1 transglycosylase SLT domain-containing protein [Actinoplanes ovalisporus]